MAPCWMVGRLCWRAGCISQNIYLRYIFNLDSSILSIVNDSWDNTCPTIKQILQKLYFVHFCSLPQDQPPISPFDPSFCDPPEPGVAGGFNGPYEEFPLISAITDVSSLSQKSLLDQNSECPFGFCKRPSLARPGNLICCQRRRRIIVCPNSCD